jgi:hypothetical protein
MQSELNQTGIKIQQRLITERTDSASEGINVNRNISDKSRINNFSATTSFRPS